MTIEQAMATEAFKEFIKMIDKWHPNREITNVSASYKNGKLSTLLYDGYIFHVKE